MLIALIKACSVVQFDCNIYYRKTKFSFCFYADYETNKKLQKK